MQTIKTFALVTFTPKTRKVKQRGVILYAPMICKRFADTSITYYINTTKPTREQAFSISKQYVKQLQNDRTTSPSKCR